MTANESTALTTILLVGGVGSIPILFASFLFRGGAAPASTQEQAEIYRPHPFVIWLSAFSTVLVAAVFIAIVVLLPKHEAITMMIFGGAAVAFLVLGWFSTRKLRAAYVLLTPDAIESRYGRRVKTVRYADIWAVHFRMGYITVLTAPRKVAIMIPPMFRNSGDLLRRLTDAWRANRQRP